MLWSCTLCHQELMLHFLNAKCGPGKSFCGFNSEQCVFNNNVTLDFLACNQYSGNRIHNVATCCCICGPPVSSHDSCFWRDVRMVNAGTSMSGTAIIFCTKSLKWHVLPFPLFSLTITTSLNVDPMLCNCAVFKHKSLSGWGSRLYTWRRKCNERCYDSMLQHRFIV